MGPTCVRTKRIARVRMKEWSGLSLSFSYSPVRLRFKLDRVQVRPMADVAKLPCDSGFTLSRFVHLAFPVSLSVPFRPKRKCEWEKTGKLGLSRALYFRFPSHDGINKYVWLFVSILLFIERGKSVKLYLELTDNEEDRSKSVVMY